MPLYKFSADDIFHNRLKAPPAVNFYLYNGTISYNNGTSHLGELSSDFVNYAPPGNISLYELNVDRPSGQLIYPFVTKEGSLTSFSTTSTTNYNNDFSFGDTITGSYPLTASIAIDRFAAGVTGSSCKYYRDALKNTLNRYGIYSPAYSYSSSLGNKGTQEIKIISIPSIFYGSSIKRGTCSLKIFVSGTLVGELRDHVRNGELKQMSNSPLVNSSSVGGVVLYDEGFIVLTGSWGVSNEVDNYGLGSNTKPRWVDFGYMGASKTSYQLAFSGTTYISTTTMMAHAPKGELNHSNNPTFIKYGQSDKINYPSAASGTSYIENSTVSLANIIKTNYSDPDGAFQKVTYISKIGIYDKYKNLIAIANLATPVRKRQQDGFTFKLKLDI